MQACVWCAVRDSQQTLDIIGHIDGLLMVIYKEMQGTGSDVFSCIILKHRHVVRFQAGGI